MKSIISRLRLSGLLVVGVLCAGPAAAAEKAAATASGDRLALPWPALREPWQPPKNDKAFKERVHRAIEELARRQGEIYKQINEGKVDKAFPTVWDVYVLEEFLTVYVRGGRTGSYFEARFKEVLDEATQKQMAAEKLRVEDAITKYREEARQEYEAVLKAAVEGNTEWAAAGRRLKEATAKLEALGVNDRGEPKDGSRKLTAEETTAAVAAVKEYKEAEGAARRFSDAFQKDPENRRLKTAAEQAEGGGVFDFMIRYHGPLSPHQAVPARERFVCKEKMGWFGREWLLVGPDPAPDPALPRVDESVRKPGTAKTLDLGPSTRSSGQGGVKLELVWIPPGEFMMGSPTNEPGRYHDERLHRVKLTNGFWMGKYEVTQEQWQQVMGNNPSWFKNAGPQAPVETVRFDQVKKFIRKLGEMTAGKDGGAGGKFRLPTEAEWEWACRAGTDKALYNGKVTIQGANNGPELDAIAWYGGNSGVEYEGGLLVPHWPDKQHDHRLAGTHPVGGKKPNAWGLYDMLGNVAERCEDWYYAYPSQAVTDPTGPKSHMGDSTCGEHVVRGGGWGSIVRLCRSASRDWTVHEYAFRNMMIGFRVAMDEPATAEKK